MKGFIRLCLTMILFVGLFIYNTVAYANTQLVNDTPIYQYEQAKQNLNIMWDDCPVGQFFNANYNLCEGNAIELTWRDAQTYIDKFINAKNYRGYNDWRLPTLYEQYLSSECEDWETEFTGEKILAEQGYVDLVKLRMMRIPNNNNDWVYVPVCANRWGYPEGWTMTKRDNEVLVVLRNRYLLRSYVYYKVDENKVLHFQLVRDGKNLELSKMNGGAELSGAVSNTTQENTTDAERRKSNTMKASKIFDLLEKILSTK